MKTLFSILCFSFTILTFAQYGTGIGTETPDNSAELHVVSPNSNTGVLIPSMIEGEMNSIVNPANGLMIYNTTRQKFMYNVGTAGAPSWCVVGELPRLTAAEIIALPSPPTGMIVFNTSVNTVWYFDGTNWQELSDI